MQPTIRRLIPLGRLLGFEASKGLPEKVLLFKWGQNDTVNGPVLVNEFTAQTLPRMQKAAGFDTVALDFEHNTVPGSREYQRSQEPRSVAAHGTPFVRVGEGMGIELLTWTPSGRENAANYPDVSACVALSDKREVAFLHSGTLARQGAALDMHLFTAGISDEGKFIKNLTESQPMQKLLLSLFTVLGLTPPKDDASDEQIAASVKCLLARLNAGAVETFTAKLDALKQEIVAATAKGADSVPLQTFTARLDALEKAGIARDREALLIEAQYQGKVVPASVLPDKDGKGGLDLGALKMFIAEVPVTVPLEQRTRIGLKTFTPGGGADSAETRAIRDQLSISKDDVEKYGAKK
jgi:hypothetical protein